MPRKRRGLSTMPHRMNNEERSNAGLRPLGRPKNVTMTLQTGHSINGVSYGPGRVTVSEDLASFFRESERNYQWTEQYLRSAGSALIGGGSRLLDSRGRPAHLGEAGLPAGFFENPSSDMALSPVARIDGGGM